MYQALLQAPGTHNFIVALLFSPLAKGEHCGLEKCHDLTEVAQLGRARWARMQVFWLQVWWFSPLNCFCLFTRG